MEKQQGGCRRIVGIALPAVAVVIMMAVVFGACGNQVAGPSKRTAAATAAATTAAAATAAATAETMSAAEHLKSLVVCERVTVLASMYWGQAPGLAYAGNPATSGQLEVGDVLRFLMPVPNAGGEVRVEVFPHDGRAVGKSNNLVWISWETVANYRLDLVAFRCDSGP